jgi:epidermal growth factor receptor substrate 15
MGDAAVNRFKDEFPPITLNEKDESDSESEPGFEDDFTQPSPAHRRKISQTQFEERSRPTSGGKEAPPSNFFMSQPPVSELPRPDAQKSPPSYNTSTSPSAARGSNDFPAEYGGLLPSRENPMAPPSQTVQSAQTGFGSAGQGHALFGGSTTSKSGSVAPTSTFSGSPPPTSTTPASTVPSDAYHTAASNPTSTDKGSGSTQHSQKHSFGDEFDADFADLTEAKEDDGRDDEDFMFGSQHHEAFDEFNPAFDSPAMSKSGTMASERTPTVGKSSAYDDTFGDFDTFKSLQTSTMSSSKPTDDWDAMMKSINSEPSVSASDLGKGFEENEPFGGPPPEAPEPPKLGRSVTESSVHDDPSVKRLVQLGYSRSDVVRTLEKYDYDFDKVGSGLG